MEWIRDEDDQILIQTLIRKCEWQDLEKFKQLMNRQLLIKYSLRPIKIGTVLN